MRFVRATALEKHKILHMAYHTVGLPVARAHSGVKYAQSVVRHFNAPLAMDVLRK